MNHSTPGLPVPHQLLKFTQTHVHRVGDASQPSHPLSSPSPPAPNPSQHQGLKLAYFSFQVLSMNPFMSLERPHLTEFEFSAQPLFHDSKQLSFGLQGSSV